MRWEEEGHAGRAAGARARGRRARLSSQPSSHLPRFPSRRLSGYAAAAAAHAHDAPPPPHPPTTPLNTLVFKGVRVWASPEGALLAKPSLLLVKAAAAPPPASGSGGGPPPHPAHRPPSRLLGTATLDLAKLVGPLRLGWPQRLSLEVVLGAGAPRAPRGGASPRVRCTVTDNKQRISFFRQL